MDEFQAVTSGIDHVGLTVRTLEPSVRFFIEGLGWHLRGEKPEYPAAFVSDGRCLITLWAANDAATAVSFDRKNNIGLHHLAFRVESSERLDSIFARVSQWPGVVIEFAPEFSGSGPKRHFMIAEPGGNRIEFSWDPRSV